MPALGQIMKQALADSPTTRAGTGPACLGPRAGRRHPRADCCRRSISRPASDSPAVQRQRRAASRRHAGSGQPLFDRSDRQLCRRSMASAASSAQVESKQAGVDLAQYQLGAAYLTLTGNVALEAIAIAAVREEIKTVERIIADDVQNVNLVKTAALPAPSTDGRPDRGTCQLANDRTLLPQLHQRLSVARHALAVFLGKAPSEWTPPDFDLGGLHVASVRAGVLAAASAPGAPASRHSRRRGAAPRRQRQDRHRHREPLSELQYHRQM